MSKNHQNTNSAWLIWGIGATIGMYQFMLQSSASVLSAGMAIDFSMSNLAIGAFAAIYFYTYLFMQIPAGRLLDRYGARKITLLSLPCTVIACLLLSVAQSAEMASFSRLLMGLATAPAVISAMFLAANWFSAAWFPIIVGLTELLCLAGGGLGQVVLSYSSESFGWRFSAAACGGWGLLLLLLAWRFLQDAPAEEKNSHADFTVSEPHSAQTKEIFIFQPSIIFCGLYSGFCAAILGSFAGMWGVHYLKTTYDLSLSQAAMGTALMFLGAGISSIFMGYLSDKIGRRKPVMVMSTLGTLGIMTAALYIDVSLPVMLTLLFSAGLCCGGYMIPFTIAKETLPKSCHGTAIGFINMSTMIIGAPIYQPLIGWILQTVGADHVHHLLPADYEIAMAVIPLGLLLALCFIPFIKETYCRNYQDSSFEHLQTNT